jgi:acyl dehydratase
MSAAQTKIDFSQLPSLLGKTAYVSDWMSIDRAHLKLFAAATYLDPAHVDLTSSKNNEFGEDLIDGFLLLSLLVYWNFRYFPVKGEKLWGLNYGFEKVRFVTPVMVGDKIRATCTVKDVKAKANGWLATLSITVEKEGSERPAMTADWLSLFLEKSDA